MRVYEKLLEKGIITQEELQRALYSISHLKSSVERDEAEWECTLDWANNNKYI